MGFKILISIWAMVGMQTVSTEKYLREFKFISCF